MEGFAFFIGLFFIWLLFSRSGYKGKLKKALYLNQTLLQELESTQDKLEKALKFKDRNDSLSEKNDDFKMRNAELRSKITDQNLTIKDLKGTISDLKAIHKSYSKDKFDKLTSDNRALITENSTLSKDNLKLSSEFNNFRTNISKLETELSKLNNIKSIYNNYIVKHDGLVLLQDEVVKIKQHRDKGVDVLNRLKETIDNEKKVYSMLQKSVQSFNVKLENMQKQFNLYEDGLYKHEKEYDKDDYDMYKPKYSTATQDLFETELQDIYDEGYELIKENLAVLNYSFHYNDEKDAAYNRRSTAIIKNMINLFNIESDKIIENLTFRNANKSFERIKKIKENINKINKVNDFHSFEITDEYLTVKLKGAELKFEYENAKKHAKEQQELIKAQMREDQREEKRLQKERLEALKAAEAAEQEEKAFEEKLRLAQEELQKNMELQFLLKQQEEQNKFDNDIKQKEEEALAKELEMNDMIGKLKEDLRIAQELKERNKSMAQQTRSGYVYIISNIGSFGDGVVKIGMTRRLEPMDRVKELGDASVPFSFDVHAMIYSKDAPALENELHKQFADNRVNLVNFRKEFFSVDVNLVCDYLKDSGYDTNDITLVPTANDYYESLALRKLAAEQGVPVSSVIRDSSDSSLFELSDDVEDEELEDVAA